MESGMDFDREVSEALDRQAATQALIDAVVVKAAKERKATAAAKAAEKAADKLMKRKRNKSASTAGRQRSQCKEGLRRQRHLRARAGAHSVQGLLPRELAARQQLLPEDGGSNEGCG